MSDYVGIKIPENIIIVEKYSEQVIRQGYVVDAKNSNMLESAKEWAKSCIKNLSTNKWETIDGQLYTYKNGEFKIQFKDSANGSSQGGKLSFWNCIITAPDNKQFLIGINSDFLVEFILNNTLVNGACEQKIYLGRISSTVGVFTANMPSYKQFIEDEKLRAECKKTTSSYQAGDIVKTLTTTSMYLGELPQRFQYQYNYRGSYSSPEYIIYMKDKSQPIHVFKDMNREGYYAIDFLNTKPKRTFVRHSNDFSSAIDILDKYWDKTHQLERLSYTFSGSNEELKTAIKNLPMFKERTMPVTLTFVDSPIK